MSRVIPAYLLKRAFHTKWPMVPVDVDGITAVVVIPVLAESERLFLTLQDLAANDGEALKRTLIVCVVNNRRPEVAGAPDCDDNQRILAEFSGFANAHPNLRLTWIDAASPGRALADNEGVGLARKIGLDTGLRVLHDNGVPDGPLISLDGDTRVAPDYLTAIHRFFAASPRWAAVVAYAHPVEGDSDETRAILAYEFFLRYQEMALHYAGSPYHYPAIGSTMVCTGKAYATSSGMNRRQAGEDFYFLQQLAKTGRIERIWDTTVVPASRPSHRVPFGTGRKVGAFADDADDAYLIYDPETFCVLRQWLGAVEDDLDREGARLIAVADGIWGPLGRFLVQQHFDQAWDRMRAQCKSSEQRQRQFHSWFDAFRTLKLTHHLRDHAFPRQNLFEALGVMLGHHGIAPEMALKASLRHDLDAQRVLLGVLREWRPVANSGGR